MFSVLREPFSNQLCTNELRLTLSISLKFCWLSIIVYQYIYICVCVCVCVCVRARVCSGCQRHLIKDDNTLHTRSKTNVIYIFFQFIKN
jgi:hypothetical protein